MAGPGVPYRYLAQGLADPESALANQYETDPQSGKPMFGGEIPNSSLHDYYMKLIGKTGADLGATGMLPSQQLPKMPGWTGDALEPAETPDLQVHAQAMGNSAMTKAVTGLLGQVPMTTWGARHGQKPGEYRTSPAAQAAQDMAEAPWQLEQERVATANKIHAFHNQYAFLKSQAKTKDQEMIIDQAKSQATAAAFGDLTTGQLEGNREAQKERVRKDLINEDLKRRGLDISQQNADTRVDQGNRRLSQGDQRLAQGDRRIDMQGEAAVRAQHKTDFGTSKEYTKLQHMDGAVARIDDLLDGLNKDPQLQGLKNTAFHWGDVRLASKDGENLDRMRNSLLENLTQLQERMGTRGGSKYLEREIGMMGDSGIATIDGIWQLRDRIDMARWGFEQVHPGMKDRPQVRPSGTQHPPGRPPPETRAPPKLNTSTPMGGGYENMSEEELDAAIAKRRAALGK